MVERNLAKVEVAGSNPVSRSTGFWKIQRISLRWFVLEPILSRSGVKPPTGTIHPRESRGEKTENWNQSKGFIAEDVFPDSELREDI